MNSRNNSLMLGAFLILLGGLILLNNIDFIYLRDEIIMSLLFLALGGYMLFRYLQSHKMGTLIFASILLFIGLSILIDSTGIVDNSLLGTIFFWGVAALFATAYVRNAEKWGLIIPIGVLFTLGLIVLLHNQYYLNDDLGAAHFFLAWD